MCGSKQRVRIFEEDGTWHYEATTHALSTVNNPEADNRVEVSVTSVTTDGVHRNFTDIAGAREHARETYPDAVIVVEKALEADAPEWLRKAATGGER